MIDIVDLKSGCTCQRYAVRRASVKQFLVHDEEQPCPFFAACCPGKRRGGGNDSLMRHYISIEDKNRY